LYDSVNVEQPEDPAVLNVNPMAVPQLTNIDI